MYFNIEISILDQYSLECEKVHLLVFINYIISLFRRHPSEYTVQ